MSNATILKWLCCKLKYLLENKPQFNNKHTLSVGVYRPSVRLHFFAPPDKAPYWV